MTCKASDVLSMPTIPAELWMLWSGSGWVLSIDDAPGGETHLVAFSEQEAIAAAEHQKALYVDDCIAVRVK